MSDRSVEAVAAAFVNLGIVLMFSYAVFFKGYSGCWFTVAWLFMHRVAEENDQKTKTD